MIKKIAVLEEIVVIEKIAALKEITVMKKIAVIVRTLPDIRLGSFSASTQA
jgi:hypothetical protein